jgi:glyoxylase-like metal-dependent hydrolase (beta-lactamase superfamily II)/rhodanese-related sulfurtransferase
MTTNTEEFPSPPTTDPAPLVRQIPTQGRACLSYLIADPESRLAVVVDPRRDQVDTYLDLLKREGFRLEMVIDTHTHADHLSGAAELARRLGVPYAMLDGHRVTAVSRTLTAGERVQVGRLVLEIVASPGHTPDGLVIWTNGHLFTGDTLLIGGAGRADFLGGDPEQLYDSLQRLIRFPRDSVVWPAHDYHGHRQSTLRREQETNPLYSAGDRAVVVERLAARGPLPPGMAEVLAFNRRGDEPGSDIDPRTVHEMLQADPTALRLIDVRTRQEVDATSIVGATNLPLDAFEEHIGELRASASLLVLLCESGNRARLAAQILERHDMDHYRVLHGGMRGWVKAGLPHQGGRRVLPIMRQVQLAAGLLVLTGLGLGAFVDHWFYLISALAGGGLTVAGLTGYCGMALLLARMPWNRVARPAAAAGPIANGVGGTCETGGAAPRGGPARGNCETP